MPCWGLMVRQKMPKDTMYRFVWLVKSWDLLLKSVIVLLCFNHPPRENNLLLDTILFLNYGELMPLQ